MKTVTVIALLIFFGCNVRNDQKMVVAADQKLRHTLFCECLEKVPKSPETMGKSDWAKIVSNCDDYAYYSSMRVVPKDSAYINIGGTNLVINK